MAMKSMPELSTIIAMHYQFDDETKLLPIDQAADGARFSGRLHASWNIGSNPNGGYLMALVAATVRQLHPHHPDPLSITAHYLRPGQGDQDCQVQASLLRTGKSVSTARACLVQDGKSRLEILSSFGELQSAGPAEVSIQAPAIPPPDECVGRSGEAQGVLLTLLKRLDIKLHPDQANAGASKRAEISGWIRFKDGRPPDSLAALLFADAFPPAVFSLLGQVGWVPTIELTVNVRRRPVPGWMQVRFQTLDLADGRMIEDGMLWDAEGHLVAQSRQLAMLLPKVAIS
jgi:acyl-CoA thioesterase